MKIGGKRDRDPDWEPKKAYIPKRKTTETPRKLHAPIRNPICNPNRVKGRYTTAKAAAEVAATAEAHRQELIEQSSNDMPTLPPEAKKLIATVSHEITAYKARQKKAEDLLKELNKKSESRPTTTMQLSTLSDAPIAGLLATPQTTLNISDVIGQGISDIFVPKEAEAETVTPPRSGTVTPMSAYRHSEATPQSAVPSRVGTPHSEGNLPLLDNAGELLPIFLKKKSEALYLGSPS